jgi:hypothetical protein
MDDPMSYRLAAACASLLLGMVFMAAPTLSQGRRDLQPSAADFSQSPFGDPDAGSFNSGRITGTVRTFDGHA